MISATTCTEFSNTLRTCGYRIASTFRRLKAAKTNKPARYFLNFYGWSASTTQPKVLCGSTDVMCAVKNAYESLQLLGTGWKMDTKRKSLSKKIFFKEIITAIDATRNMENGLASDKNVYHSGCYLVKKMIAVCWLPILIGMHWCPYSTKII